MLIKSALVTALVFGAAHSCIAQEQPKSTPIELEVLKASVGVWDAEVEVWSQGPDSPSMKFNGVETNRLFGEYWIASDSEYVGMKLHSIVGYDLDQKKMVGTVIDHGPYAASMTGDYDKESKTIHWMTKAKDTTGKPIVQKTSITQKNADERVLVLWLPGKEENEFTKFMQIRFVKRKEALTQEPEAATSDSKSISLFNGKDLTGWHIDVPHLDKNPDAGATFVVRDGKLVSLGQPNGHLITDSKYENYRLDVEYRFAGKPGNCGVLVHASTPRALYKMFPKSIEVQMNHGHAGDFWCIVEDITVPDMEKRRGPKEKWGITEGKARRILNLTDDSEKPAGEWNTMVIECVNDAVKVWVNGVLVNHGTGCTASKGQIALQAEGSEVEFRKLSLAPIAKLTE